MRRPRNGELCAIQPMAGMAIRQSIIFLYIRRNPIEGDACVAPTSRGYITFNREISPYGLRIPSRRRSNYLAHLTQLIHLRNVNRIDSQPRAHTLNFLRGTLTGEKTV